MIDDDRRQQLKDAAHKGHEAQAERARQIAERPARLRTADDLLSLLEEAAQKLRASKEKPGPFAKSMTSLVECARAILKDKLADDEKALHELLEKHPELAKRLQAVK